jgi:hypothetical protein
MLQLVTNLNLVFSLQIRMGKMLELKDRSKDIKITGFQILMVRQVSNKRIRLVNLRTY